MAVTADSVYLPPSVALFPPPLHIAKKPRRATFRQRLLQTVSRAPYASFDIGGPLDDIIDEITGNIWQPPPGLDFEPSYLTWVNPRKTSATWSVTPLPVSRIPSDQPLNIRKNRNSRSTASGSSGWEAMVSPRDGNQGEPVSSLPDTAAIPWPSLDEDVMNMTLEDFDTFTNTASNYQTPAQRACEGTLHGAGDALQTVNRHTSRLRRFTTNVSHRFRRTAPGDADTYIGSTPNTSAETSAMMPLGEMVAGNSDAPSNGTPKKDAVHAYLTKHGHDTEAMGQLIGGIAQHFPSPVDFHFDSHSNLGMPSTLNVAMKALPEVKLLSNVERQEFWVSVQVEGVLYNRRALQDPTLDIVFVIDNGYQVTKHCLKQAVNYMFGALSYLQQGDRVALYSTHCTHAAISGIVPETLYPLRPFNTNSEEIVHDLLHDIGKNGTQTWVPPRPNPPMAQVIIAIAKQLSEHEIRQSRAHIIILSPNTEPLHNVHNEFPSLTVYQVNPGPLPVLTGQTPRELVCMEMCCRNTALTSNYANYQSVPGRIKKIIKYARSEKPLGRITDLSIDIRPKSGCEVLEVKGSTEIPELRLGQVHSFLLHISAVPSELKEIDPEAKDPILAAALEANNLDHELSIAKANNAVKPYVLSIQVLYKNPLSAPGTWGYSELPLFIIKEQGTLSTPLNILPEVFKRLFFSELVQLAPHEALESAKKLEEDLGRDLPYEIHQHLKRLVKEATQYSAIAEYEQTSRQKLPLCTGPISLPAATHEWLVEKWDAKRNKRKGMIS